MKKTYCKNCKYLRIEGSGEYGDNFICLLSSFKKDTWFQPNGQNVTVFADEQNKNNDCTHFSQKISLWTKMRNGVFWRGL